MGINKKYITRYRIKFCDMLEMIPILTLSWVGFSLLITFVGLWANLELLLHFLRILFYRYIWNYFDSGPGVQSCSTLTSICVFLSYARCRVDLDFRFLFPRLFAMFCISYSVFTTATSRVRLKGKGSSHWNSIIKVSIKI